MNDVEANEAVINKNWFRQVADAEAPSLQSEMGVTTRLHMTRPQWVTQKLQSEATLSSPFGPTRRTMVPVTPVHHAALSLTKIYFLCMHC